MSNPKSSSKQYNRRTETKPRNKRGLVSINVWKGNLRLTVPATLHISGEQKHIPLKMANTPENVAKADLIKSQVNAYIQGKRSKGEELDRKVVANYIAETIRLVKVDAPCQIFEPSLDILWEEFFEFKKANSDSYSFEGIYITVSNHLSKLTTRDINEAEKISIELRERTKSYSARYFVLSYLSACCKRAVINRRIKSNPFVPIMQELKAPNSDSDPDPFSSIEKERVIQAYRKHPKYHRYANLAEFLFEAGCRPGMAFGLRWKHVNFKENYITFCESVSRVRGGDIVTQGTKNRKHEKKGYELPMENPRVREILEEEAARQGVNRNSEGYVFQEPNGERIRPHNYSYSWRGQKRKSQLKSGEKQYNFKGIVNKLADLPEEEGGISHYRPPYSTRHTYITEVLELALQRDDISAAKFFEIIANLAKYVNNSPKMILDHYLGRSRDVSILNISKERREEVLKHKRTYSELKEDLTKAENQLNDLRKKLQETEERFKEQSAFSAFCLHQLATKQRESSFYTVETNQHKSPESFVEQNQPINYSSSEFEQLLTAFMLIDWQDSKQQ
ncbi:site-specific integrase [Leptolyngbya ohadii]|uniref:site-specific integrase n=1 Tax=Leptolyngbya ohadii TaxID=1962290 RepID=UPI000B59F849|nr:tyrosine-type recombinase/integrase [Leptolyngbya ohadii]